MVDWANNPGSVSLDQFRTLTQTRSAQEALSAGENQALVISNVGTLTFQGGSGATDICGTHGGQVSISGNDLIFKSSGLVTRLATAYDNGTKVGLDFAHIDATQGKTSYGIFGAERGGNLVINADTLTVQNNWIFRTAGDAKYATSTITADIRKIKAANSHLIYAVGNTDATIRTEETSVSGSGKIMEVNGANVKLTASKSVDIATASDFAVQTWSSGNIDIEAPLISIKNTKGTASSERDLALYAGYHSSINIKGDDILLGSGNGNVIASQAGSNITVEAVKSLTVDGDIGKTCLSQFSETGTESTINLIADTGAVIDVKGDIVTSAMQNSEYHNTTISLAEGASLNTRGTIQKEDSALGGVAIVMAKNAKWSPFDNADIKTVTSSDAEIDLSHLGQNKNLSIDLIAGSKTTVRVNHPDKAVINANHITGTIDIHAEGSLNDQWKNTNDLLKSLAEVVKTNDKSHLTVSADEGLITDAVSASISENGTVTDIKTSSNTYLQAVSDITKMQALTFRSQINNVSRRMGELRSEIGNSGSWVRAYGGKNKYNSDGVSNKYQTIQMGVDTSVSTSFGKLYVGLTGLYNGGDSHLNNGTAEDTSFSGGLYAGLVADNGGYVDVIIKGMHLKNDFNFSYTNGRVGKGSYKTNGLSASVETGWRVINDYGVFAEPQLELMYGHLNSFSYTTSAGVHGTHNAMDSTIGRVGLAFGKVLDNHRGSFYLTASILNDFDGKQAATYRVGNQSRQVHADIGGSWIEAAIGGTYRILPNLSMYGEITTTHGTESKNPFQWNIGGRLTF